MGAFKSGIALENALRNHRKSNKPPVLEQNQKDATFSQDQSVDAEDTVNGKGIFQNPVQDEEEPGHVPIADIMKHDQLAMHQQQSGQRPPSK